MDDVNFCVLTTRNEEEPPTPSPGPPRAGCSMDECFRPPRAAAEGGVKNIIGISQ